jgi:hypothetical protein
MRNDQVLSSLKRAAKGGPNSGWFAIRGLGGLKPGVDPKLVAAAMRRARDLGWSLLPSCRKLPDEYVPLLRRVLKRGSLDQVFLETWLRGDSAPGPQLREAAGWMHELSMVDDHPKGHARAALLSKSARGLEAAQAAVAARGVENRQLLAVLARDGSPESVDVLMPLVLRALDTRDRTLDLLHSWLAPFAKGPLLAPVLAQLTRATDERENAAPLEPLLRRFGVKGAHLHLDVAIQSREVYAGFTRRASIWLVIQSRQLPHVKVFVTRHRSVNFDAFRAEDGKVRPGARELKLKPPGALETLPAWIAGVARTLKVHWDRPPRVSSSLRGAARQRAVDWLLGG